MDRLWSETCWNTFKYFIILIVSTYYILCISWIIKCLMLAPFFPENHAVYEIMWKNMVKPDSPQTTDNITLRSACRITKQQYRHKHSEYVTIITASWLINSSWSRRVLTQTDQLSLRSAQPNCASAGQWAAPGNMHCCRRHEFDIKALLYNGDMSSTPHTKYIVGFPLQQWLRERVTMLRYTHTVYLVYLLNDVKEITRCVEITSVCPSVCAFV